MFEAGFHTSEASPYETSGRESEMVWGQMQVLAELSQGKTVKGKAIVATEKALPIWKRGLCPWTLFF